MNDNQDPAGNSHPAQEREELRNLRHYTCSGQREPRQAAAVKNKEPMRDQTLFSDTMMDMDETRFTLSELNRKVAQAISDGLDRDYWVEAELAECRVNKGHCYMTLVEKDEAGATPKAKASAKCWASNWQRIAPFFERETGQPLHAGLKVLLKVYPQFHEAYGFSWIVTDINPAYTLGDLVRRRQEIVRHLKQKQLYDLQRRLRLPLFCQRVAVVSSSTAAGYGDFCAQLAANPCGFRFAATLFQATMQGETVERSIIAALDRIASSDEPFDCVVIIRGGGDTSDFSGFETLPLAERVATFPLPVISGIGHERDGCVIDEISFAQVITPTAAAQLLIENLKTTLDTIEDAQQRIARRATEKLAASRMRLSALSEAIPRLFSVVKIQQTSRLDRLYQRLATAMGRKTQAAAAQIESLRQQMVAASARRLSDERHRIELAEGRARALDPALLLKRGYSITLHNGKAVRSAQALKPGDRIETRLNEGILISTIE